MLRPSIFRNSFVDDMFDDFFHNSFWKDAPVTRMETMSTDIKDMEDHYQIEMNLPGFTKEDVNAELKNGYLTISAEHHQEKNEEDTENKFIRRERYQGMCRRSFYVGEQVAEEDVKAKFKDGVLVLEVPKKEKQPEVEKKKYIAIEG